LFLKVTHSSGNHGQAVAWAAGIAGVKSCVVIPRTAPKVKAAAIEGYGAELVFCEPNPQSRYCYGNMTCFSSGTAALPMLRPVRDYHCCELPLRTTFSLSKEVYHISTSFLRETYITILAY
jgi:hypothetical protein